MSEHLKYSAGVYKIIGFWPLQTTNKLLLFLNNFYFGITIAITILAVILNCMEIPEAMRKNLKEMVSCSGFASHFLFSLTRCGALGLPHIKRLIRKIEATERNIMAQSSEEVKALYLKHVRQNKLLNKLTMAAATACGVIYTCTPLVVQFLQSLNYASDYPEKEFPLNFWFPFDKYKYYWSTYCLIVIFGIYLCLYAVAGTNLVYGLLTFVIGQLQILQYEIRTGIDSEKFNDFELQQNVNKMNMYYNEILKFTTELNYVLKFLMMFQFITSLAHTALISFEIAVDTQFSGLVKNLIFLIGAFMELALCYWFGSDIYLENCKVIDAVWESDWYNCSQNVKKSQLILMIRATTPVKMMVGYSQDMSMETMMMLIKSSISYAIALNQFYAIKNSGTNGAISQ